MSSRRRRTIAFAVVTGGLWAAGDARGVNVPLVNAGFDAPVTGAGFTYEGTTYAPGSPMPNHTFLAGVGVDGALGDSHSGTTIGSAFCSGYAGSPNGNTGLLFDTRDFNAGQGPTGPGAFINVTPAGPVGIYSESIR